MNNDVVLDAPRLEYFPTSPPANRDAAAAAERRYVKGFLDWSLISGLAEVKALRLVLGRFFRLVGGDDLLKIRFVYTGVKEGYTLVFVVGRSPVTDKVIADAQRDVWKDDDESDGGGESEGAGSEVDSDLKRRWTPLALDGGTCTTVGWFGDLCAHGLSLIRIINGISS